MSTLLPWSETFARQKASEAGGEEFPSLFYRDPGMWNRIEVWLQVLLGRAGC